MQEFDVIQRERERKGVTIVYSFLHALRAFRRIEKAFRQGALKFPELAKFIDDRGESFLFTLKTACHQLFRQNFSSASEKEQIFDLTIGSIFHLAMKLREDLYQIEFYGPKYTELHGKKMQGQNLELGTKFKDVRSRATASLREGMEEGAVLMEDAFRQFRELLKDYRQNGLLLRFLLEEKGLVDSIFGEKGQEKIFALLFDQDEAKPYRLAGESYLQSAFYSQAARSFSEALKRNPEDESLQFKIYLSQGMEQFYAFNLHEALKFIEQCLVLSPKVEILETHRTLIRKICQKIQEEFPGKRKDDQHRDLVKKAKAIQKKIQDLPPDSSDLYPT